MIIEQKEFIEAWDRIARTSDGHLIYRYFQMRLMGILDDADPSPCALRGDLERRKFAAELMGLMAQGIDESAGSASANRPVVFVRRPAIAGRQFNSVRERIAATDPELRPGSSTGSGSG